MRPPRRRRNTAATPPPPGRWQSRSPACSCPVAPFSWPPRLFVRGSLRLLVHNGTAVSVSFVRGGTMASAILVHGGTPPPPLDSRRGHGLRLPRPGTRPLRFLIPGGTRPLRLLVCGDAGVAASTPPSSAVGARASTDTNVADAASVCLSAAGRQPSPDSEVVEIAAGAETKDDFGPVPPDEGRGSQRSFFRVDLYRTVHGLQPIMRHGGPKNQVGRSAPNQAGPSAGHHGRCADCIIRGWFRRAAAVGRAIVPLYFLASSKKDRFLRSFTLMY